MKKNESGFTMIELMVVIVIISILAAVIVPRFIQRTEKAAQVRAKADIVSLKTALHMFKLDTGRYPTTGEGLQALRTAPGNVKNYQKGGYLEKDPRDPWGNIYTYTYPGSHGASFDIVSYGADNAPGGTDESADIESWNLD